MIWGDNHCEHQWKVLKGTKNIGRDDEFCGGKQYSMSATGYKHPESTNICSLCGAWKGAYGLEPTPEMYVQHTIEILREIRRVLRKDGVVFWNIGDSYWGGKGRSAHGDPERHIARLEAGVTLQHPHQEIGAMGEIKPGDGKHSSIKPKDLCLIPFRIAIAAQEDGWWVRSVIIWSKPNPMPESVHGSHFIRHYVTIEEYEKLSGMQTSKGGNKNGSSHLSRLSQGKISDSESPLSGQPQRAKGREGLRTETRSQGETATTKPFPPRTNQSPEIYANREGVEGGDIENGTLSCKAKECGGNTNSGGLDRDIREQPQPMLLLQKEEEANNRPYNSTEQGWTAQQGEHSPSLPELQFPKARQDSDALIECPGCPKCKNHNGYIRIKGSGRPTESHEYILMLTKSDDYFFDTDAVREPHLPVSLERVKHPWDGHREPGSKYESMKIERMCHPAGRNIRTVWEFPTQPYPEAHFAVFPEKLPELCIKAATPEVGCCSKCGAPWERITVTSPMVIRRSNRRNEMGMNYATGTPSSGTMLKPSESKTLGWQPTCKCNADKVPSLVLDPFLGAGTTLWVAKKLNRRAVGYEISEEYCQLDLERCRQQALDFTLHKG